jgi:hypothetical protein
MAMASLPEPAPQGKARRGEPRRDARARQGRVEERHLEGVRRDRVLPADELIHPRLGDGALAGLLDVEEDVGITRLS